MREVLVVLILFVAGCTVAPKPRYTLQYCLHCSSAIQYPDTEGWTRVGKLDPQDLAKMREHVDLKEGTCGCYVQLCRKEAELHVAK